MSTIIWRKEGKSSKRHFDGAVAHYFYMDQGRLCSKTLKTTDPQIALQKQVDLDKNYSSHGTIEIKGDATWDDFLERFKKRYSIGRAEGTTVKMDYVSPWVKRMMNPEWRRGGKLHDFKIKDVKPEDFESMKEDMLRELQPETINSYLNYIKQLFIRAHAWGIIPTNPSIDVKNLPCLHKEARWLKVEEREKALTAVYNYTPAENVWGSPDVSIRALGMLFAQDAGMRGGEIIHQRMEDIDPVDGWIKVAFHYKTCICRWCIRELARLRKKSYPIPEVLWHPKGRRERDIPLTPRLLKALQERHKEIESGLIIPFRRETLLCWAKDAYTKSGITGKAGVHTLRHTLKTEMRRAGMETKIMSAILGHSERTTGDHYDHTDKAEIKYEFAKLTAYRDTMQKKAQGEQFTIV